jgi:uncharacterized protein YndB with AHSA1/START domain
MLKLILIAFIVLIAIALFLASTKPDTFRIERSINIKAPPEKIFPLIANFHEMKKWSAWEKVDPNMQRSITGPDSGIGAMYAWDGNKEIGQGSMEILEATPSSRVLIKIDFYKPFEAHNTVEFTLTPQGESTTVSNAMYGPNPFVSKLMSLVFSMDKMVGPKFEEGLASLKAIAEK